MRARLVSLIAAALLAWPMPADARQYNVVYWRAVPASPLDVDIHCRPGDLPGALSVEDRGGHVLPLVNSQLVDSNGVPSFEPRAGGGYSLVLGNNPGPGTILVTVVLACTTGIGPVNIVTSQANVAANSNGSVTGFCPSPQVPVGHATNAGPELPGHAALTHRFSVYLYVSGTPPVVTLMDNLADGVQPAPAGIGVSAANATAAAMTLRLWTFCAGAPGARTLLHSQTTLASQPYAVFAPVPDGWDLLGYTNVGGLYGSDERSALWGEGVVSSELPYAGPAPGAVEFTPRAVNVDGKDNRAASAKASARAVVGLFVAPATGATPAPTIVTVVEFYHAGLDHYVMTSIADEIHDLDTGVHVGWQRTGESFKAYGAGSTGHTGRRPVCRAYGNPAAHLDSHFYSASIGECIATLANFNGAWLLEAMEVFELELPDAITGACPAGTIPVYRVWNNRADSNHRYTTSLAIRNQMVARGFVAEGYGPDAVTLCALA